MSELSNLIAELEKAEAGSRELDAAIFKASVDGFANSLIWPFVQGSAWDEMVPHYTTSIDAALTLFDEKDHAQVLYEAVRETPLTERGGRRFALTLVKIRLVALKAREAGQ